jgi:U3 small nucleolar ribonucleoprotein protein IMP3
MRRYHIQNRDDYKKYNKICGMVTKLTSLLKKLDGQDSTRIDLTDQLLDKWVTLEQQQAVLQGLQLSSFVMSLPPLLLQHRSSRCRLFNMGVLPVKKSLVQCDSIATSAFCRRRLSVVMVRLKMAETLREACTFIEQVHTVSTGDQRQPSVLSLCSQ